MTLFVREKYVSDNDCYLCQVIKGLVGAIFISVDEGYVALEGCYFPWIR